MTGTEYKPIPEETNVISKAVIEGAFKVHKAIGPGLLESVYEICLCHELHKSGLRVRRQVNVPVVYDNIKFDAGFRLDLLVEEKVIVEIKAVDDMNPVFDAQLLTYLKLTNMRVGLLINYNYPIIKKGIKRLVL